MSASAYVDDTDTDIYYDDGWTLSSNTEIVGEFGPPLYGTLHIARGAAQFSYKFTGFLVEVIFPIAQGNTITPDFNCTVDGITLSKPYAPSASRTGTSCFNDRLPHNGTHELIVSVAGTPSNPVMFDYITYSGPQVMTDADFMHSSADVAVTVLAPNSVNPSAYPLPPGATLNIEFDGYSIGLYGSFSFRSPHAPSFASYTVDGGSPINFTVSNPISSSDIGNGVFSQLLLQTPRYPVGKHNLQVLFFGTNDTTPLSLSTYVVQNSTTNGEFPEAMPAVSAVDRSNTGASTSSSLSSASSLPTFTSQSNSDGRTPRRIHSIIWGMVTTVAFVLFLSVTILLFLRRRRKKDNLRLINRRSRTIINPFEHHNIQQHSGKQGLGRIPLCGNVSITSKAGSHCDSRTTFSHGFPSPGALHTQSTGLSLTAPCSGVGSRRILIHEDSGAVISQPGTDTRDILELPPTYTTIGLHMPLPPSSRSSSSTLDEDEQRKWRLPP